MNAVVTVIDGQDVVTVDAPPDPPNVVVLQTGYPGPQGPQGPPGGSGADGQQWAYVHTQEAPGAVWTVQHNLAGYPSVTTVDSAYSIVEGSVTYLDAGTVRIEFTAPFGGKAFFS